VHPTSNEAAYSGNTDQTRKRLQYGLLLAEYVTVMALRTFWRDPFTGIPQLKNRMNRMPVIMVSHCIAGVS
jgi:hypothetical protein